jgi:tetratricopeptide (TPR) repeat protein
MIAAARIRLLVGALAMVAGLGSVASAWAQDAVRVRAWQHSDFARVVFDWPAAVGYETSLDGRVLSVRFDRALAVGLAPVRERLVDYVQSATVSPDGRAVVLELTRSVSVSDFTNENSVVVDLRPAVARDAEASPASTPDGTAASTDAVNLRVRVGDHPGYSRIVFDWPSQPGYEVARDGRAVTVSFGRAARIDVAALSESLPPGILAAAVTPDSDGNARITFAVPETSELRHFPLEEKVVLDVLADSATRAVAAEPLAPEQLPQVAEVAPEVVPEVVPEAPNESASDRAPDARTDAADETEERTPEETLAEAVEDGTIAFREGVEERVTREEAPAAADATPPDTPTQPDTDAAPEPDPETAEREPIPAPEADVGPEEGDPAADPEGDASARAAEAVAAETEARDEEGGDVGPVLKTFSFQWPQDVGAAVFRRAENIWIVFDESAPIELAPLRVEGAPIIERIDQLPIAGTTVLRMNVPDRAVNAAARREGFNWVVEFRRGPQRPQVQAPITADVTAEIGPHLNFPSDTPGKTVNVPDPEMGDLMRIATMLESGAGIDGLRRYPEFELLPTAQGIVMIALSDSVLLDRNFDGFQVSAPDGLAIQAVSPEAPVSSGPVLSARRLFDLDGWVRGPPEEFVMQEEALFRSLGEVPREKLNEARLNYAGFLFAHRRPWQALGVLRVVEKEEPQRMDRVENRALRAANLVLAGRLDEAAPLLADPRLDGFAEAAIWRAAARALENDQLAAGDLFGPGDSLLTRYPYPLKSWLGLIRIETAFANRDSQTAEAWIDALERDRDLLARGERAALDFERGRLAVRRADLDEAEAIFEEVMTSGDRKYAYKAEQNLITLGLNQGFMDPAEAIERYERLRYAWRGDRAELFLLRDLGRLYLDGGDFFEALEAFRTAVRYFPDDPVSEDLAGEMTELFSNLFLEGGADDLAPLRAVALYEEFKELTPAGELGDRLIENIADRLAAIDLLPEAAEKLEELLADEERLPDGSEERTRLSNKLALIYLMDGKPGDAERALGLAGSFGQSLFGLESDLAADRDRLLARVRFQQNRYDDAVKELAGDVTTEADLLRRDIYRTTLNWQESAKVLQRLAGNPPEDPAEGVEGERARYVINWAVALYQNEDRDGIRDLVDLWGPAMGNSSLSGVFDYITTQQGAPAGGDVLDTVDQLIGADRFDAFLSAYRERLFAPPPDPTVEVSATSS